MLYKLRQVIPRGRRDDMPPPADGSSTRGGSTSVRGRVRSPHMAKSQPTNNLVHIGVKTCISGAAVFVDFPKNKCNFLYKNMFDILRRVQFLAGRLPMRSFFSWGSRHHCPMEVGACAQKSSGPDSSSGWKSASLVSFLPVLNNVALLTISSSSGLIQTRGP